MTAVQPLPLEGVKVLDLSALGPGPFMTQALQEMGARIVKIERPPVGDLARVVAPGSHRVLNSNKESLWIDLKAPDSLERILGLAAECDMVVEGFRPGVAARLGLGYEAMAAINPSIIYVSISGFGQSGPRSLEPGHDLTYLAASGFLALTGEARSAPAHAIGVPIADFYAGLYALSAALAALLAVRAGGAGRHIDVSMTACMIHVTNAIAAQFQHSGLTDLAAQRRDALLKPGYGVFEARDGVKLAIGALEDHFWAALVAVLGVDLAGRDFSSYPLRAANALEINGLVAEAIARLPGDEVLSRLLAADVPVSRIVDPLGVDPQLARFDDLGGLRSARFPVDFGGNQTC